MRAAPVALAALLPLAIHAADFQRPTETESRAAYCIAVLERDSVVFREVASASRPRADEARDRIDDRDAALNKLQAWLKPRISSLNLDPRAIATAQARAKEDYRRLTESGEACLPRCRSARDARACLVACMDKGIQATFDACRNPDWLPN